MDMKMDEMTGQIKEMQESMAMIIKQMDEVLRRQSHLEAELNALRGTDGGILNGHSERLLIDRGMSPADVSEVMVVL